MRRAVVRAGSMTPFTGRPADYMMRRPTTRRQLMKWHTPKIVEIACGCEINAYFPADY
jgi:coenzyme PQQ precursor peptide PqqA